MLESLLNRCFGLRTFGRIHASRSGVLLSCKAWCSVLDRVLAQA